MGSPKTEVLKIAVNASGSAPTTWRPSVCQVASAYSTVPVPSVAMNESIRATSTNSPLTAPSAAPASNVSATAIGQSSP